MNMDKSTPRILGAAFLLVIVASFLCDIPFMMVYKHVDISDNLINISNNLALMRMSILFGLVASIGIIVLATVLYAVLHKQSKIIALVAFGMYMAEAIILAVSKVGAYALITLSSEFAKGGAVELSYLKTLANFFYKNIYNQGYDIHNLFFCIGAILWYILLYKSKYIPRGLSIWGLGSVSLVLVNTVLMLYDPAIGRIYPILLPYIPFEAVIGIWLMTKGFSSNPITSPALKLNSDEARMNSHN
jgi:hypothetical protein